MDQCVANYRIGIQTKKWWWSLFVWIVDVVFHGARVFYGISKHEGDESLPFLSFWRHIINAIFLKYSKEDRLSSSHVGIWNTGSDVCYNVTKRYQVQSERRRSQNPFKPLRWSVFVQTVNTWKLLTEYPKTLHLICLNGFWICLCSKTKQVQGVQKELLWNIHLGDACFEIS